MVAIAKGPDGPATARFYQTTQRQLAVGRGQKQKCAFAPRHNRYGRQSFQGRRPLAVRYESIGENLSIQVASSQISLGRM